MVTARTVTARALEVVRSRGWDDPRRPAALVSVAPHQSCRLEMVPDVALAVYVAFARDGTARYVGSVARGSVGMRARVREHLSDASDKRWAWWQLGVVVLHPTCPTGTVRVLERHVGWRFGGPPALADLTRLPPYRDRDDLPGPGLSAAVAS